MAKLKKHGKEIGYHHIPKPQFEQPITERRHDRMRQLEIVDDVVSVRHADRIEQAAYEGVATLALPN